MLLESQGSNPCRSNMPKTFLQKLTPQLFNTWLVHPDNQGETIIFVTGYKFFEKWDTIIRYDGYYIKSEKGVEISTEGIQHLAETGYCIGKVTVDIDYLLDTYKLVDAKLKDKLNRLLAKKLLRSKQ